MEMEMRADEDRRDDARDVWHFDQRHSMRDIGCSFEIVSLVPSREMTEA